jgi:NTE family protein
MPTATDGSGRHRCGAHCDDRAEVRHGQTVTMTRVGLVLGAGGLPGHAWHCGVLAALADETGWDARRASVVVGTSAGAGVGAYLRAGLSGHEMYDRLEQPQGAHHDERLRAVSGAAAVRAEGMRWRRPQAPTTAARALLPPWRRPGVLFGALVPQGEVSTGPIGSWAAELHGDRWPDEPLWVCAVDLASGRRVVFGRDPLPPVGVGTAVEASSAVPGFFQPVTAGGRLYIDGGIHSPTNADLLADSALELGLVVVSSPMSASSGTRPVTGRSYHHRLLEWETRRCRETGSIVLRLEPGADLLPLMSRGRRTPPADMAGIAEAARRSVRRHLRLGHVRDRLDELARSA